MSLFEVSDHPITTALNRLQEYVAHHSEHDTDEILRRARAALAEPADGPAVQSRGPAAVIGDPRPAPPAEGEVAELVLMLHHAGDALRLHCVSGTAKACDRAAELLGRNVAPVPVPVAEGLPGPEPEDCDAEGRCWIYMPDIGTAPSWRLVNPREIGPYHSHWLPAHALPLPAQGGEVEP